jgi:hypothetical protein
MPVSILALIHKSIIPTTIGVDRVMAITEKLYFSKTLKITAVIPTEKITENK